METLTDEEMVRVMRVHFESQFPRDCPKCRQHYATLREYILDTQRVGATISYDAELGDWNTVKPIGALALANCRCGTTMALGTETMPLAQIQLVLRWVETGAKRRGVTPTELIGWVRDQVRLQALRGQ